MLYAYANPYMYCIYLRLLFEMQFACKLVMGIYFKVYY